ncbi:unnamed protein product [Sphagnum balticum]
MISGQQQLRRRLQAEEKESQKAISVNVSLMVTDSRYSEAVTGRAKQLHAMQHKDQRQQPRPQKPGRKLEAESSDDDDRYGKLLLHLQLQTLHSSTTAICWCQEFVGQAAVDAHTVSSIERVNWGTDGTATGRRKRQALATHIQG